MAVAFFSGKLTSVYLTGPNDSFFLPITEEELEKVSGFSKNDAKVGALVTSA